MRERTFSPSPSPLLSPSHLLLLLLHLFTLFSTLYQASFSSSSRTYNSIILTPNLLEQLGTKITTVPAEITNPSGIVIFVPAANAFSESKDYEGISFYFLGNVPYANFAYYLSTFSSNFTSFSSQILRSNSSGKISIFINSVNDAPTSTNATSVVHFPGNFSEIQLLAKVHFFNYKKLFFLRCSLHPFSFAYLSPFLHFSRHPFSAASPSLLPFFLSFSFSFSFFYTTSSVTTLPFSISFSFF